MNALISAPVNHVVISHAMQSHSFVKQIQSAIEKNSSAMSVSFASQSVDFLAYPSVGAIYVSPDAVVDSSEEALMTMLASLLDCETGFVLWHADWSVVNQTSFEAIQLHLVANDWRNVHLVRVCSTHELVAFVTKLSQFGSMRRVAQDKWTRVSHVADAASVNAAERPALTDAEQAELVNFVSQIARVGESSARALLAKVDSLAAIAKMDEKQLTLLNVVSAAQAAEIVKFFRTNVST
jgi:hypothetical protein